MLKTKFRLVSKKIGSNSLKALQEGLSTKLGYKVWRGKSPKPNRNNIVYGDCKDKLQQYQWFHQQGITSLEFTTSKDEASSWLEEGATVFARTLLRSSEGKGIVILEKGQQAALPNAGVFTKYKKKKREFRVHVFKDQVVHVLEKRKKAGYEKDRDTRIRNTANGYVFCSDNVVEPVGLRELALAASKVTNSDFRGVDIGFNEKLNELFVIEVNSAPGIQGTNVDRYVEVITNAN